MLRRLIDTDNEIHLAIVAERMDGNTPSGEGLGIAASSGSDAPIPPRRRSSSRLDSAPRSRAPLVLALVDAARERGIHKFRTHVQPDNEPAQRLLRELEPQPRRTSRMVFASSSCRFRRRPPWSRKTRSTASYDSPRGRRHDRQSLSPNRRAKRARDRFLKELSWTSTSRRHSRLPRRAHRFIEAEIKPLERADDNVRFFDHRREWARTDFDRDGLPRREWEELLEEMRRRADRAGHFRYALPKEYGGKDGTNLAWRSSASTSPPRASASQRPAERELDRRQSTDRPHVPRFRHPAAEGRIHPRMLEGKIRIAFA